jgi:GntR family transcriptional regulator
MKSLIPVYYEIKQNVKRWILNGDFGPGEQIPSENDLVKQFHVSRLTIRQALSELSQEGFLFSKRGVGTFVTTNEKLINSSSLEVSGFLEDLFYQISEIKTKTVEIDTVRSTENVAHKLHLEGENDEVIRIRRVRFRGLKSFAYTINYLPVHIGSRISKDDLLNMQLLYILEHKLRIRLTEAIQTIEASFAGQDLAEILNIPAGSPILYIERTMFDKEKPVEVVESFHRGDIYKYLVRLKRVQGSRGGNWIPQAQKVKTDEDLAKVKSSKHG